MDKYALFFDIDGTLVSFRTHRIPDSAVGALEQAKARGHRIYIATGRPMAIVNNLGQIEHLIDGYITTNGAYSFVGDETVNINPIKKADAERLLDDALRNDYAVVVSGLKTFGVWNPKDIVRRLFVDELAVDASTMSRRPDMEIEENVLELTPFINAQDEARLMNELPNCQSARWHPAFCDITSRQADKGKALPVMAVHEGFDLRHTMAFGDGGNDISIIRNAGIGVAMGNGLDTLKEVADFVTTSVDDDGIRNALEHYRLI